MMNSIDAVNRLLNRITMYRLVVCVLVVLTGLGIIFSFTGRLSFSPTALIVSLFLVVGSAYAADRGLSRLFHIPTNMESSLISALIIFLIVQPANSATTCIALVIAGSVSSASKFLIAWNGKHLFNPAAFAAALLSLTGLQATTWWVGSSVFWPFSLVMGLAIVFKIRRVPLFLTFSLTAIATQYIVFAVQHQPLFTNMKHALIASPLLFLATVMLTEPATMPPRRNLQVVFAAIVAVLYVFAWKLGPFIIYPEVALLLGNIFAFAVSPKLRVRLELKEVQKISERVYNYIFLPERRFTFLPGQYMEWTLAGVPYDSRGNRRTLTIASSPTESNVQLGIKYYEPASTYKSSFYNLRPGDAVYASQLAGNFTVPAGTRKLAFIAGGIGITPFRSIVKDLTDRDRQSDITLLYIVSDPQEFAYIRELKEAARVGIKTIPVVTNPKLITTGMINAKLSDGLIARLIPDYPDRMFYISGPGKMVDATKRYVRSLGKSKSDIVTDHFSGY